MVDRNISLLRQNPWMEHLGWWQFDVVANRLVGAGACQFRKLGRWEVRRCGALFGYFTWRCPSDAATTVFQGRRGHNGGGNDVGRKGFDMSGFLPVFRYAWIVQQEECICWKASARGCSDPKSANICPLTSLFRGRKDS